MPASTTYLAIVLNNEEVFDRIIAERLLQMFSIGYGQCNAHTAAVIPATPAPRTATLVF